MRIAPAVAATLGGLVPGSRIFVRYEDAGEDLLHERLVGWSLSLEEWVLEPPDGDKVAERLFGGDHPGAAFRAG